MILDPNGHVASTVNSGPIIIVDLCFADAAGPLVRCYPLSVSTVVDSRSLPFGPPTSCGPVTFVVVDPVAFPSTVTGSILLDITSLLGPPYDSLLVSLHAATTLVPADVTLFPLRPS